MSDEEDRGPVSSRTRRGAAPTDTGSEKGLPRTPRQGRAVGGRGGTGRRGHTGRGYTRGRRGNRRGRGGRGGSSPSLGPTAACRGTGDENTASPYPSGVGDDNTVAPSTAPEAMASEKTTPSLRSASNGTEHPVDTAVTATEDQVSGGVSVSAVPTPGVGDENTASSTTSTAVSASEKTTPSPSSLGGNKARLTSATEKSATAIVEDARSTSATATDPDVADDAGARSPMFSATTFYEGRLSTVSASEDLAEEADAGPSAPVDETQPTPRTDRSDDSDDAYNELRRYQLQSRYRYYKKRGDARNDEIPTGVIRLAEEDTIDYRVVEREVAERSDFC